MKRMGLFCVLAVGIVGASKPNSYLRLLTCTLFSKQGTVALSSHPTELFGCPDLRNSALGQVLPSLQVSGGKWTVYRHQGHWVYVWACFNVVLKLCETASSCHARHPEVFLFVPRMSSLSSALAFCTNYHVICRVLQTVLEAPGTGMPFWAALTG